MYTLFFSCTGFMCDKSNQHRNKISIIRVRKHQFLFQCIGEIFKTINKPALWFLVHRCHVSTTCSHPLSLNPKDTHPVPGYWHLDHPETGHCLPHCHSHLGSGFHIPLYHLERGHNFNCEVFQRNIICNLIKLRLLGLA